MRGRFLLPLFPLQDSVLLPGGDLRLPVGSAVARSVLARAQDFGGAVVAALVDGESVNEVGVTAMLTHEGGNETALHGVSRCRLVSLVSEEITLVQAERYPEVPVVDERAQSLARLLATSYTRLCRRIGRSAAVPSPPDLSGLTWRVTAALGLPVNQQQEFLNVPDPLTRGRLLLIAVRELGHRERFLRPWAHLRTTEPWN
jgi:Lon protease-like protein